MNTLKITDILTGKNVWQQYQIYCKTQWYTDEEMKIFQIHKLKKILNHCYLNIPYYKSIIDNNKIDIVNFNSLDVLLQFPLLTKEKIQENYKLFIPQNNHNIKGVKTKQTGGTTGNILFNRNDSNTRSSVWATYKRYEDWMGIVPSDKTLILMGGHVKEIKIKEKIIKYVSNLLSNSKTVDIYDTSEETIENVINLLKNGNYSQIRSYPQFLFSVAQKLEEKGLFFKIKAISTTAEPVLPIHRTLFKKVFKAEVFDQYGCGEIGGIAYECEKHEGLHIAEERVIIEKNEFNELIITDLDNFTMPLIRYWNADQAIFNEVKCSCGRNSKLVKELMGRTCDYVLGINGQFLHWAYFWHLIFDSNVAKSRNLRKFQIVQETNRNLTIRLVSDEFNELEKTFIIDDIQKRLGEITIKFSFENSIEDSKTGKYRPVINKLLLK